jgi:hypothetical protein
MKDTTTAMHDLVRRYLKALEANDVATLVSLFEPEGVVDSPLLGRGPARTFFAKVAGASSNARLTVHDVFVSAAGNPGGAAYFRYDWWLKDDTHPLRDRVAGQYT